MNATYAVTLTQPYSGFDLLRVAVMLFVVVVLVFWVTPRVFGWNKEDKK